jgi:erythrocyte band 7 integral membrane protein
LATIKENKIGIVTKNGKFDRILKVGMHFVNIFDGESCIVVDAIVIGDNQKGIQINRGKFEKLLDAGQYYENPVLDIKIIPKSVTLIEEGHIGLQFVNGILINILNPGIYFENHLMNEKIIDVNMQIQTKELKEQTIMTKDTVSVQIHSVLVYQITNAKKAICDVENIDFSIRESIKVITQQVLSENSLDDCMTRKQFLSDTIKKRVETNCVEFGIKIIRVDIKDIFINDDNIKEALASSAIAKRMAESKLINAEAEVKSAELMKKAADQLGTGSAMHIRQLETIMAICKHHNSKVHVVVNPEMMKMT